MEHLRNDTLRGQGANSWIPSLTLLQPPSLELGLYVSLWCILYSLGRGFWGLPGLLEAARSPRLACRFQSPSSAVMGIVTQEFCEGVATIPSNRYLLRDLRICFPTTAQCPRRERGGSPWFGDCHCCFLAQG